VPEVLAWGNNRQGDLGDGLSGNSDIPVQVTLPAGTRVTVVRAGFSHSVALTSTGQVLDWGANAHGELGDRTLVSSNAPVPVRMPGHVHVIAVRAGCSDSLALTSAGQVLAWGDNVYGQLGNGTRTDSRRPVRVRLPAGTRVTQLSTGCFDSYALTSAGQVLSWAAITTARSVTAGSMSAASFPSSSGCRPVTRSPPSAPALTSASG
jgi:alpha-tubulin suppressor-like RCC1 family protein